MRTTTINKLKELNACRHAIEWVEQQKTKQQAWDDCERGDWMLWLLAMLSGSPESKSRKKMLLPTCECARLRLAYVPEDEKSHLIAIEITERWAKGDKSVSLPDVWNAADAAAVSIDATYAAYAAAAAIATDAADAADDAVYAVARAAASAYTYAYVYDETLKQCADIVRKYYPKVPRLNK